jgi:hypothetical protein
METNENPKKNPPKFKCFFCYYYTSDKKDLNKHLNTTKHKRLINANGFPNNSAKNHLEENLYYCKCGRVYKHMSSLCKHKKSCGFINIEKNTILNETENEISDKELIMMLVKENSEFKNMMFEFMKNGTHNTTNNHINSHNKTFNLQFFLNETCKDAMNITDFIESVKLQLTDLESVGKLGYVDGISNIILKYLKALDVEKRPVHCADSKREILYIKDDNKWEREDDENMKIKKLIKRVADKNTRLLPKFKEAHPDCVKASSQFSDQYNKIIIESMGGSGNNDSEKEEKIIKNISKHVIIDKAKYSN